MRKRAFTLTETLVALVIIGVVAAMTIPNLVNKYNEEVTVTKLKKAYNTLSTAYNMVKAEDGNISDWFSPDEAQSPYTRHKVLAYKFKPYLRVAKECGYGGNCLAAGYVKSLSNINYVDYNNSYEYKLVTRDNLIYQFYVYTSGGEVRGGNIKVYINGKRRTHVWGKDAFSFRMNDKGIRPYGLPDDTEYPFDEYCNISKSDNRNGIGCTAWVIENENMDYLHCPQKLSWDGKHSCKD